jgi:carotenoid cleavage dioxygenase-like enzyme
MAELTDTGQAGDSPELPAGRPRYARGFESLDQETPAAVELPVRGALPPWLDGALLRNGPAKFEAVAPDGTRTPLRHWFDGQAMLHRFAVHGGRVHYTSRYVDTPGSRAIREEGRITAREFATDPCASVFQRVRTIFRSGAATTANPLVNVVRMGEEYAALTEVPLPVRFDPETLATLGVAGYRDDLRGQVTTAHPHADPATGDLVNVLLDFGMRSTYRVYRQRPGSPAREQVAAYRTARPSYLHSFAVTPHYAVLALFPFRVNPLALLLGGRPFAENFRWEPEAGTDLVVLNLRDGSVRGVYPTRPLFAFHQINAYEDGERELVLDLCAYPDAGVVEALYLDRLRSGAPVPAALPTRIRIDLDSGRVDVAELSDEPLELPAIDYRRHNGRAYRTVFGAGSQERSGASAGDFLDQLVRLDTESGTYKLWREDGCYPGEPVFVPAPGGESADAEAVARAGEGVLLSVVLDSRTERSFLLALDAVEFTELARAEAPAAVPFGFHGLWQRSGERG